MKKIARILLVTAVVMTVIYFGLIFTFTAFNKEAEEAIEKYAALVDKYRLINGNYPREIEQIEIPRKKLFLVLTPLEIQYSYGEQPELWYGQIPLGPLRVYNLSSGEWSFAE